MRRFALVAFFVVLALAGCGGSGSGTAPQIKLQGWTPGTPSPIASRIPVFDIRLKTFLAPVVGEVFTTDNGRWSFVPTSFSYAWQDCDSNGANCVTAAGSPTNTSRYAITSGDATFRVRSVVTASDATHTASQASVPTGIVNPPPPTSISPPIITGTPTQGQTLTTTNGTWTSNGSSATCGGGVITCVIQWQRCSPSCSNIVGANGSTYLLALADVGNTIRVVVTATNGGGSTPATSAQTPAIASSGGGSSAPAYSPLACTQTVTTSTYVNAVTNAAGGAVICLSAGTYGSNTFSALDKTSTVTVEPSPGATVHLGGVVLQGANHVTFMGFSSVNGSSDSGGLTISGQFGDLVRNTTWSFNAMPNDPTHPNGAGVIVNTNPTANANILIQNNKFIGYGNAGEQDRTLVNAQNDPSCPDGITISFNEFEGPTGTNNPGAADGTDVDGGTCGTQILNNIYHDIKEASCGPLPDGGPSSIHCDSIQDNGGGATTTINGNYFFNDTIGLRFDDGSVQDTVTNNVFDIPNVRCVEGEYGSPSQFSHNTFGNCEVNIGQDHNGDRSNNLTMTNNAFGGSSGFTYFPDCTTWGTYAALNFNVQSGAYGCSFPNGANDKIGTPTFVGGTQPSTWAGWALTSGSLGHLAASDGKDMGADVSITPGPSW